MLPPSGLEEVCIETFSETKKTSYIYIYVHALKFTQSLHIKLFFKSFIDQKKNNASTTHI